MKRALVAAIAIVSLLMAGCVAGLSMVYKNPASGEILLVRHDGTTEKVPLMKDGAVLTGIVDYWQKNSGGLTPSPLAIVKINPDGTFKIVWTGAGPGLTKEALGVVRSAVQGAVGAAISVGAAGHTEGGAAGHTETGHGGDDDGDNGHNDSDNGHDGNEDGGHEHNGGDDHDHE